MESQIYKNASFSEQAEISAIEELNSLFALQKRCAAKNPYPSLDERHGLAG